MNEIHVVHESQIPLYRLHELQGCLDLTFGWRALIVIHLQPDRSPMHLSATAKKISSGAKPILILYLYMFIQCDGKSHLGI